MPAKALALHELADNTPGFLSCHAGQDRSYASSIVTDFSVSPCLTALTMSWPDLTCPNTVCLPSNQSVTTCVMKNWLPFVLGPAFAIDSEPTLCRFGLPFVSSSNL